MRLFGYYAWHSFINQVKKMLKTWVLIFILVCMVIGGAIGFGAAWLSDKAEEQNAQPETETVEEEKPSFLESQGVEPMELIELIAGGLILAIFVYETLSADRNGGRLFLPADVPLLFAAPMKPQSVLTFRLMTKLGTSIFLALYLMLQLPNLMLVGLSAWGASAVIVSFCLTILVSKYLQVLLFLLCSERPGLKANLNRIVYLLLALVFGGFLLSWKTAGGEWLPAAVRFFDAPVSRYVPVWGWLKGFFLFVAEDNVGGALLCLVLIAATVFLLAWASGRVHADFYEDAMAKSEEVAELLATAQRQREGGMAFNKRKKDRSDKIGRDGLRHGQGANVFFFKQLYNRFRFAHFHFFTKTSETYLAAAIGVWALCRYVLEKDPAIPSVLVLAVVAFYRALGNPLEEDTKMGFFILIPESMWSKLFYSLLGGTVSCVLDLLPALIVVVILTGMSPLIALAWLVFIASVDFYSTAVGVFIGLSVPANAGGMIKQFAQILFVYFGLLPDVVIMALGIVMGYVGVAAIGSAVLNAVLGLIFFSLSPRFLEPKSKSRREDEKCSF